MFFRRKIVDTHALEHLKAFAADIFIAFQSGDGGEHGAITLELAIKYIWRELTVTLLGLNRKAFEKVCWARIELPTGTALVLDGAAIKTLNCVGARTEDGNDVYYVTFESKSAGRAASLLNDLESAGASIRDWRYGC